LSQQALWPRADASQLFADSDWPAQDQILMGIDPAACGDARLLRALGGAQLPILDDWGLEPLDAPARHDFLEILEERLAWISTEADSPNI
jgi:hypothetical protein